jgi:hypothetical protein
MPASRLSAWSFAALQLAFVAGVLGVIYWRMGTFPQGPQIPTLRETPLVVTSRYDVPEVVTDEELQRILPRLRPRLNGKQTKIGGLDHALRFWTAEARFDDPQFVSGAELRSLLTDHRAFAKLYGEQERPLLIPEPNGVRVRSQEGSATSTHFDHTVACLAEVGTPLDFPVVTAARGPLQQPATFRDMLEFALTDFSLNQFEYEWSIQAFALYAPTKEGWLTKEGQRVTYDVLAQRLMRERLPRGVCFGNHRLYTLAVLLQIDETNSLLSPEVRRQVLDFLTQQSVTLLRNQHAEGYWSSDWARQEGTPAVEADATGDVVSDRILATGHALEWWAIAPEECLPPRENIVRASRWLVKTIDAQTDSDIASRYTYLTHAGRALCLWRKFDPAQIH